MVHVAAPPVPAAAPPSPQASRFTQSKAQSHVVAARPMQFGGTPFVWLTFMIVVIDARYVKFGAVANPRNESSPCGSKQT